MKQTIQVLLGMVGIGVLSAANNDITGPGSVENQIQDDAVAGSHTGKDLLERWKAQKQEIKERTGFFMNSDYSAFYLGGTNDFGPSEAGSGIFRVYGGWDLVDRGGNNQGGLIYKVEHRHRYVDTTPAGYSLAVGNVGFLGAPFSDNNLRLTNLYWKQKFADGRGNAMLGYLDATDYVDIYGLANPWTAFTNLAFSTGGSAIALPNDATFGAMAAFWLTEQVYAIGSISDLNADPTDPFKSADYFFSRNEYFKSLELGWTTSQERAYFDNIDLTFWHADKIEATANPDGWGLNFSATKWVDDIWMPFLRAGYTEDGGSLLETSVSAGVGYQADGSSDLLGAAFNWGRPNENTFGPNLDDQYTIEVFYRYQLTENIALTPDIQFLINPALNPQDSSIFLGGLRARIVF
ncbi:carbohydrate porin [Rubritalea tangerina]|uniref:Carbohydrate porin n=1 Tax=Rubritalea tangerina TaxID=430798 RepID=A0ABW4ZAY1_9BACT